MIVDEVGPALLIRRSTDPAVGLVAMTGVLAPEHGRIAIVGSPSITSRPDFFRLVAQIIDERVRDTGVRLVPLGSGLEPSTVESGVRALAHRFGHEVVGPLGSVTVSSNGIVAAAAPEGARGGWVTCVPGGQTHYEPAWSPPPPWARKLSPETACVVVRGMAAAHPVPAGYWILPRGVRPGGAGAAAIVAPDDTMMTIYLGGCAGPPLTLLDVTECLTALPHSDQSRLVLLPGALPPGGDTDRLRAWCGPSLRVVAAVPARSDENAWSLTVGATDGFVWRPPHRSHVQASDRSGSPRGGSVVQLARSAPRPPSDRPMPAGVATPAGWSFLIGATPIGNTPASAGYLVEVCTDAAGFVVDGTSVGPGQLADLIDASCRPLTTMVVVPHGTPLTSTGADSMYGALADALGREIIASDSDVSLSPTGVLYTAGQFRSWPAIGEQERVGESVRRIRALGDTLPPSPVAAARPPRGSRAPRPAAAARVAATPASSTTVPLWVTAAPCDVDDQSRLRQVLDDRYDVHAQAVGDALAEVPGLRDLPSAPATVIGLVAVRAYCAGDRGAVNQALRGLGDPRHVAAATTIASCAAHGLLRLPVVFGPVFATNTTHVSAGAYDLGSQVVEPGFVDVSLSPNDRPGPGLDYLIWSVSARRLVGIASGDQATALFTAGSRFLVLDIDVDPERPRVMLLDLAAPPGATDRPAGLVPATMDIVERLCHAARRAGRNASAPGGMLDFPPGLDDSGRPYPAVSVSR